jgi:hypothetical protein
MFIHPDALDPPAFGVVDQLSYVQPKNMSANISLDDGSVLCCQPKYVPAKGPAFVLGFAGRLGMVGSTAHVCSRRR